MINIKLGDIARFGDVTEFLIETEDEPTDYSLIPNDYERFPFVFHMDEFHLDELGAYIAAKPKLDLKHLASLVRTYFALHETEVIFADCWDGTVVHP